MFPYANKTSVPHSFLRNNLNHGVSLEDNTPVPKHPDSEFSHSNTSQPLYPDPYPCLESHSYDFLPPTEPEARKMPPTNGYTSKVHVLDRYKVVGFISSGTYGRVYKAVGLANGMSGEFAIKKSVQVVLHTSH